jgi:DNA-directed RNA polymerase specialized sigma24 family protein
MTAKEYLQQYRDADRMINAKLDQIRRLRELATKTTQTLTADRVQTSAENKVAHICATIADLDVEVNVDVDRLAALKRQIEQTIQQVPNSSQRVVLERRYINGQRWEEIAVVLGYTYRNVCYIHGRALHVVSEKIS